MMNNFVVEIKSQTASFRNPNFQNFHKTLTLPPPTTIVGLAGAALGLSPLKAQEFFEEAELRFGIYGNYTGKCNDTWKYNKRTKEMWKYNPNLDGSVMQREFLIQNTFFIAFTGQRNEHLDKLLSAFQSPQYALTMGNSDSLAFVKNIYRDMNSIKSSNVEHCIIKGDVVDKVMRLAPQQMNFSIYQTSEPITYDLPVRFKYKSDYGKRSVSSISTFSFVGKQMKLNYEIEGLGYKDIFIPLFSL